MQVLLSFLLLIVHVFEHYFALMTFRLMMNNSHIYSSRLLSYQVLVIIDVKPKDLGLPTEAYISVEEIHDVSEKIDCTRVENKCQFRSEV